MRTICQVSAVVILLVAASSVQATNSYISADLRQVGLYFDDGSGLSAEATFNLLNDNQSMEIQLRNTSTRLPSGAVGNVANQVLTAMFFDLGDLGLNSGDPAIVGGSAYIAQGSYGTGKDNDLKSGDNISSLWGYGNYQYNAPKDFLGPTFVTTLDAHSTSFAKGKLRGPDYGAVSSNNLDNAFDAGLPTISDSIKMQIHLNHQMSDLSSLMTGPAHVEFGSDFHFIRANGSISPVPEPMTAVTVVAAIGGLCAYWRRVRRNGETKSSLS